MSEILKVRNGFVLRPDTSYTAGVADLSSTYVFNNAKDLGEHIANNFKTLDEEVLSNDLT